MGTFGASRVPAAAAMVRVQPRPPQEQSGDIKTVLVAGLYGLIGAARVRALTASGLRVEGFGRDAAMFDRVLPGVSDATGDLRRMSVGSWSDVLVGVDVVPNVADYVSPATAVVAQPITGLTLAVMGGWPLTKGSVA